MDPTALWKMLCEALHELEQSPDNLDLRAHSVEALVGFHGLRLQWASEAFNSFLRYLKNNGFKKNERRKIRCDDMVKATTLEPSKSLAPNRNATHPTHVLRR